MTLVPTPALGRRRFLTAAMATAGALALPAAALAQARRLMATPASTAGPFYPVSFPADIDNDLVQVRGMEAEAEGTVTHVMGRILDRAGRPLSGATVEIWQCDARGFYLHPQSRGRGTRDRAFQGFGRVVADAEGRYSFRTIRPVPYAGRTPHIHFGVEAGRTELVTQMYVAGEPGNAGDFLYRRLADRRQREAVTVKLDAAEGIESGALAGTFDIVLPVS